MRTQRQSALVIYEANNRERLREAFPVTGSLTRLVGAISDWTAGNLEAVGAIVAMSSDYATLVGMDTMEGKGRRYQGRR